VNEFASMLVLPALLLALLVLLPPRWANRHVVAFRRLVTLAAAFQFLTAIAGFSFYLIQWFSGGQRVAAQTLVSFPDDFPLSICVYYDGVTSLMFLLVSFVGWIICGYSERYLDGEANQGRYFRWTAFTLGSVAMMVISGNLVMFVVSWVMTSLGLHKLLLHYSNRPAAQRAAWTKFTISRIGDASLVASMVLIYAEFQTLQFNELFIAISSQLGSLDTGSIASPRLMVAGWLLILGAVTKSAQFPFHTWLPQTMETPTPVSALMHAGIVNAGGYLIIRTSPIVTLAPGALTVLAIVGAFTACFAACVMITQSNIKKSLAYSTIAQMGFMMLQCGLGAFSAAMLHILAHSLYKAHAFLSSGSVIEHRPATEGITPSQTSIANLVCASIAAATVATASFALACFTTGLHPAAKPGGFLLGLIICLALTDWLTQVILRHGWSNIVTSVSVTAALSFGYTICFTVVDKIVAPGLPTSIAILSPWLIATVVLLGFASLFVLQAILRTSQPPRWVQTLYVHASNGFYLDAVVRRVFGSLVSS